MSRKRLRCGDRRQLRSDLQEVHRLLLALGGERSRGAIEADGRGRLRNVQDAGPGGARFPARSVRCEPETAGAGDDLRIAILRALRELAALLRELDAAGPGRAGGSSHGRA